LICFTATSIALHRATGFIQSLAILMTMPLRIVPLRLVLTTLSLPTIILMD